MHKVAAERSGSTRVVCYAGAMGEIGMLSGMGRVDNGMRAEHTGQRYIENGILAAEEGR